MNHHKKPPKGRIANPIPQDSCIRQKELKTKKKITSLVNTIFEPYKSPILSKMVLIKILASKSTASRNHI
jgi:hypothetical protein